MKHQLIIFDMDGTLVQSEECASQALLEAIPDLQGSVDELTERYRGWRLAEVFVDIESRQPGSVPGDCLERYREREAVLAHSMITPSVGVENLLSQLQHRKCIASNASVEKTRRSLEICGLSHHFDSDIFSAYQVQAWKPDPTLFLHAAAAYQADPRSCLVVEDSEVGLRAAQAAGIPAVFYDPHDAGIDAAGATRISALSELLDLLA